MTKRQTIKWLLLGAMHVGIIAVATTTCALLLPTWWREHCGLRELKKIVKDEGARDDWTALYFCRYCKPSEAYQPPPLDGAVDLLVRHGRAAASLPVLCEALSVNNPEVRHGAARALARIGPAAGDAVPAMIAGLQDAHIRSELMTVLAGIGPRATPALVESLRSGDAHLRTGVCQTLGMIGLQAEPAIPALVAALNDAETLSEAAKALARIGSAAVPALIERVKHYDFETDRYASMWAAEALGEIGPEASAAIPALIEALEHGFGSEALAKIGSAAVPGLTAALESPIAPVREQAAIALGYMGQTASAAVPSLIAAINDNDPTVAKSAVFALGRIGPQASVAVPALTEVLRDEKDRLRLEVLRSLWQIDRKSDLAVTRLVEVLDETDDWRRVQAAQLLRDIGPDARVGVGSLIGLLKSDNSDLRRSTVLALGHIHSEPSQSVPALMEALKDADKYVRQYAAEALAAFGSDARAAVPALKAALDEAKTEHDLAYPQPFAEALRKIEPDPLVAGVVETEPR